jgi:hypothetical protein
MRNALCGTEGGGAPIHLWWPHLVLFGSVFGLLCFASCRAVNVDPVPPDASTARGRLVAELRREGIRDDRVLNAIGRVPREQFVRAQDRARAYANEALPIAGGQTISQPYIVAFMSQLLQLRGDERVLEIGTGSG